MENNSEEFDAAISYANREYPDELAVGQWGTGDYEPRVDMEYPREIARDAFLAGVDWLKKIWRSKPEKEYYGG